MYKCLHVWEEEDENFSVIPASQIMNYGLLSSEKEECLIIVSSTSRNQISLQIIL